METVYVKRNFAEEPKASRRWADYCRYGAVYDLEFNSTRAATPEELTLYKAEKKKRKFVSFKIFPDDYPDLKPTSKGPIRKYKTLKPGRRINNWKVIKPVFKTVGSAQYLCECQCEFKTRSVVHVTNLMRGESKGCKKCAQARRVKEGG